MTVPNSFVVIVPSPSLSNKLKASLNSIESYLYTTEINYTRPSIVFGNILFIFNFFNANIIQIRATEQDIISS